MPKFRKKPVVIDAIQFTDQTKDRAYHFIQGVNKTATWDEEGRPAIDIHTLEGTMRAQITTGLSRESKANSIPLSPIYSNRPTNPQSND